MKAVVMAGGEGSRLRPLTSRQPKPLVPVAGRPIMDRRWHGRFLAEAVLAAPEARGSSPVRIVRDDATRESPGLTVL